jgi:type II secretory pathway pseudopilin PulG
MKPTRPQSRRSSAAATAAPASRARGFSLVEAMVSAGIVGVMLVASVNLLSSAARTRASDGNRRTAVLLAQQLMAEVQQQPYKEPTLINILFGPELGENARTDYDDVDDYRNYTEKPPLDRTGAAMTDYAKWQRKVRVKWVNPDTLTESLTDTGLVLIEVRVQDPRGAEIALYALRAERAWPADPPPSGSTSVVYTEVELQVGGQTPRHVVTGVNPVSQPPLGT